MSEDIVTKLKAEGNVAFGARDFEEAHSKYTQAIALDDSNAVLFANRAACSLHMGSRLKDPYTRVRYRLLDAASDSEQATSIDPKYAKAWARLATADAALNNCSQSAKSWQKALDCLPSDNLSPGELRQKEEFTAGLRSAQARGAAFDAQEFKGVVLTGEQGSHPWDVAKTMRPELERLGGQSFVSSAWVILEATEEFEKGVEAMKQVKFIPAPNGQQRMVGRTDALELISNGILRDERVFRMDCSNWIELYNKQVLMEVTRTRAWVDAGPEKLQEEALKRLRQEGWDAVRPVLATTIRVWVMRGFLEGGLKKEDQASVEYLTRALEVLNRGRQVWRNVTKEKRGVIFEDTFVRVVRSMRLHAYMEAYSTNGRSESPFSLEHLLEEAEDILRDIDEHPPAQTAHHTQGAVSSFWKYPRGRALACVYRIMIFPCALLVVINICNSG
ncbi:hypothetical protein PLICRDRAFT_51648 [Plicaturopsis crispa FD-325 SS-3]|nr:hypothetical protein PLICRDRAFT_51648 [Plicaturopsis crispa FD-325 SS-3]